MVKQIKKILKFKLKVLIFLVWTYKKHIREKYYYNEKLLSYIFTKELGKL